MTSAEPQNLFLSSDGYLVIRFRRSTKRIPVHTILYIESSLRMVIIHSTFGCFQCYQKLNAIAEILGDSGFIRCHQSYLISIDKITAYTNMHVFIQEIKLPISNRYQKTFQKQIIEVFQKNYGSLICTQGIYLGSHIRIYPEKEILIGRDGTQADLVINLPLVSRNHCSILYRHTEMLYEVTDYSSNGTFIDNGRRLLPHETYILPAGCTLCFGDKGTVFQLG